jgi:hypothetical protein
MLPLCGLQFYDNTAAATRQVHDLRLQPFHIANKLNAKTACVLCENFGMNMGSIRYAEMSVTNYRPLPRNISEERS